MKNIFSYIGCFFTLFCLAACVEDEGNYDYMDKQDVLPIEITGLDKSITAKQGETLRLSPTVVNDDGSSYSYQWFVTEAITAGALPKRYYISEEKDLNYDVKLEPNSYLMNFMVTDKKRGIYKRYEINLTVTASPTDKGWYVLKNEGDETDFDYIAGDGTHYRDLLLAGGQRVKGNAVDMAYQDGRYYHLVYDEQGNAKTLVNQSVFYILTDKDSRTYNSKTLSLFKTFNDMFYESPSVCNPQCVLYANAGNIFFINDNRLYYIYGMTANIGKFAPKVGLNTFYPQIIPHGAQETLVFDTKEHTFYKATTMNGTVSAIGETKTDNGETVSFTNMPYSMLCIGENGAWGTFGYSYCLMRHDETGDGALVRIYNRTGTNITSFKRVDKTSKLMETSMIAPSYIADFLYFAIGNKVYSYENAEGLEDKEKLLLEYPAGEEVAWIKHCYGKSANALNNYLETNSLSVLTNTASGWKLYMYDLIGESNPEINPTPAVVYEGTGIARKLLFRYK